MPEPPCRSANPFATCWTRPGALPYEPAPGAAIETVLDRLRARGWRGQLVGPHGVGKSTLMRALFEPLRQAGFTPGVWRGDEAKPAEETDFLLVEGFERLGAWSALRELHRWRAAGLPFLLTTHRPLPRWLGGPPIVAALEAHEELAHRLFRRLTASAWTPVTWVDARACLQRRRGNLRDVWFDLYDLHENRTRPGRTGPVVATYHVAGVD